MEQEYRGGGTPIGAFVQVIKGVLSPAACRKIVSEYKNDPLFDWSKVHNHEGDEVVNHDQRKVRELYITQPDVWLWSSERVEIARMVDAAAHSAIEQYQSNILEQKIGTFVPKIIRDEGYKMLHYGEGYQFKEHFDEIPDFGRTLTCSINLSSDYEGGKFQFFGGTYEPDLGMGDALIFPSNFMFPHAVTEITSGERYSIISWFH